jgi:nicotinic acid mononucleotide adenylyltransferase
VPLLLLLGADAFARLPRLEGLAAPVRAGASGADRAPWLHDARSAAEGLAEENSARQTADPALLKAGTGRIYCQMVDPQPISATAIRAMIRDGRRPDGLLPEAVIRYIETNHLYRREQCA